ncbi:MAG: hypothetical protein QY331_14325 [Melioribacteraceae bacterium]|nr:MAG: hypothetical protein QY331_14325 [Melioribacteraceae bacterium]
MNEREIYLMELALEGELSTGEKKEFEKMINENSSIKNEFEEQKRIKGVLMNMSLKNPGKEFWDGYWLSIYNKIERGIAWILISISAIVIAAYGIIEAIQNLLAETDIPMFLKISIIVFVIGIAILIFSLIREKIATNKVDKYKEIQR